MAVLASLRGTTMADILAEVARHPGISTRDRTSLASAVRSYCRALGRPPCEVLAEPRAVRDGLDSLTPGGLSNPSRS